MSDVKTTFAGDNAALNEKIAIDDIAASSSNSIERPHGDEVFYEPDSPKDDRLLTTKLDLRLIPILGLLYLICFLDRTNIANARLAGLEASLHMPTTGFNTCLWIFYIPFVLFEVPSNMLMSLNHRWMKPNVFLGVQCFILGVIAMCQGLTSSYEGLLACRFLMGIVETGLPAGAGLLIASYYRKKELSLRFALFFAFGQAGSCFSGLLAYAIIDIGGTAGLEGWRWIFIIEGLITIVFSVFVFIWVPNFPVDATWISLDQRGRLLARLKADKGQEKHGLNDTPFLTVIREYKIWLLTLLFFCADMSAGSLSSFNPTILSQLGWTARRAQVMTIPIWIVGIVGGLSSSLISGRIGKRWPFLLPAICISVVGWTINYCQVQPANVRYFAQFCISFGTFVQMPLYIGMLTANLRGRAYQSMGSAILLGLGNCANFVSSNVFITTQSPTYPVGFGTGLALTAIAFPIMLFLMFVFAKHNKDLEKKIANNEVLDDQIHYKYVF